MNAELFLVIINLILISRLRLLFRDEGATARDIIIMGLIPTGILVLLSFNISWFLLLFYLIAAPFAMYRAEKRAENLNRNRILILVMHLVILGLLCSTVGTLQFNEFAKSGSEFIRNLFFPSLESDATGFFIVLLVLFGFLMVLNEMNIVLRYLLGVLNLESPMVETTKINKDEYNTGRVIGILERIFVFVFVLAGQYSAVGFILAAKGVTRFQEFKDRTFAEYVLIGTLISSLLAMAVAFIVEILV